MTLSTLSLDHFFSALALASDPAGAEELNRRGLDLFSRGDLHGALAAFHEATESDPALAEAWNNAGIVRNRLGQLTEATADFDRALAVKPDYAEAWNNRGRARQAQGDVAGARADFDRALTCASEAFRGSVLHNRAALRHAVGDQEGALADHDEALSLNPDHAASYANRAAVHKEAGDLEGALADCDRALALASLTEAAVIYHQRGGVRALLNDFVGAVADYDEALRWEPRSCVAYVSRGNARYHLRDRRGVVDYVTAFTLDADVAAQELVRILVDGVRRDAEDVLDNCRKHLRISDHDVLAHARCGLTLVILAREEEAVPHLQRFRALVPQATAFLDRVLAVARANRLGAETPRASASSLTPLGM
jgi:tetratricopeptide (TPR) repeat protein